MRRCAHSQQLYQRVHRATADEPTCAGQSRCARIERHGYGKSKLAIEPSEGDLAILRASLRGIMLLGYFIRFGAELLLRRPTTRQARAAWLHRFCAATLAGLGVEIRVDGAYPERGAVISNHLSYLDIIVFAAVHPCVFCSKVEISSWPVIGWMTTMSGTVYVERGRGGSALKAQAGMKAATESGLPVVFFPEGTTTDGEEILPFRSGLLSQAIAAGEPITAAHLAYSLAADNEPGVTARESICWGDTTTMPQHVFRLLGLRGITCRLRFAPQPITFSSTPLHRKPAAIEARNAVVALAAAASA